MDILYILILQTVNYMCTLWTKSLLYCQSNWTKLALLLVCDPSGGTVRLYTHATLVSQTIRTHSNYPSTKFFYWYVRTSGVPPPHMKVFCTPSFRKYVPSILTSIGNSSAMRSGHFKTNTHRSRGFTGRGTRITLLEWVGSPILAIKASWEAQAPPALTKWSHPMCSLLPFSVVTCRSPFDCINPLSIILHLGYYMQLSTKARNCR